METADDDGKVKAPIEQYEKVEAGPMPPIAPDGGIAPGYGIGSAPAVPAATPQNMVCLRGPCRHYWELHTFMASGNPADTWGEDGLRDEHGRPLRMPRQINRACLAHPGTETELTEDCVFFCSRWDPLSPRELKQIGKRREKYYRANPADRPTPEPDPSIVAGEIDELDDDHDHDDQEDSDGHR